jgi:serine/threonine protein kinase
MFLTAHVKMKQLTLMLCHMSIIKISHGQFVRLGHFGFSCSWSLVGTPSHSAARAYDIYAIGLVLAELLTGKVPRTTLCMLTRTGRNTLTISSTACGRQ